MRSIYVSPLDQHLFTAFAEAVDALSSAPRSADQSIFDVPVELPGGVLRLALRRGWVRNGRLTRRGYNVHHALYCMEAKFVLAQRRDPRVQHAIEQLWQCQGEAEGDWMKRMDSDVRRIARVCGWVKGVSLTFRGKVALQDFAEDEGSRQSVEAADCYARLNRDEDDVPTIHGETARQLNRAS